jgi:hypothetical protein
MIDQNKVLLGQCIFVCKEAIVKETYLKLRQSAVEALQSIVQLHSQADFSDIVLREQISKVLFIVLPQIATVLTKVCQEETLRGPHLIEASLRTLGRFLCLILEDYEKKSNFDKISNDDFRQLLKSNDETEEKPSKGKVDVTKVEKDEEWMKNTSQNLSKLLPNLKTLRVSHLVIRTELVLMSFNLLDKCFPNVQHFARFLLENLISTCEDEDEKLRNFSKTAIRKLSETKLNINQEISDLFASHLIILPRLILTGLDNEQISGLSLLNNFLLLDNSFLENQILLEKCINILLNCCEIDVSNQLILFETSNLDHNLSDDFYQLKMPWKNFKNFKSESARKKFSQVCKSIGKSKSSQVCINYILDHISSLNHLVLIIEILNCENASFEKEEITNVVEEFLNESYWHMQTELSKEIKKDSTHEEWFKDDITSMEIKLSEINIDDEQQEKMNLKTIRYNILCTCFVTELIGCASLRLRRNFQPFILRSLHRILEKAGNSNFLIRSAGLYSMQLIE